MDDEVTNFEESILFFADAYNVHGPGSRRNSMSNTPVEQTPLASGIVTPDLSHSPASSRSSSMIASQSRRPSFTSRLHNILSMSAVPESAIVNDTYRTDFEDTIMEEDDVMNMEESEEEKRARHELEAWQLEATGVDRSVRILPGVKRMMASIPAGRYAVATSGAKTYGASPHISPFFESLSFS